jgi:branched-chain amino acid transport system substrate-binding protein
VTDLPAVGAYVARWTKEVGREPNGLPYTQYLHDAPYMIAVVFASMDKKGMAASGENFRKEMLAVATFDLPLTGAITVSDSHTVSKPVYLVEVKDGKWVPRGIVQ